MNGRQPSQTAYRRHLSRHRERDGLPKRIVWLSLSQREDSRSPPSTEGTAYSSSFPRVLPSLTCAEMGWHIPTEYMGTAQEACISRLRSGKERAGSSFPVSFKRTRAAPGPSPTTLWSLLTGAVPHSSVALQSATQQSGNVRAPKLGYTERWLQKEHIFLLPPPPQKLTEKRVGESTS